jgi:hypothetical protein
MPCRTIFLLIACATFARDVAAIDSDSEQGRLARIEEMGTAEKEELRIRKERFDRLPDEEKERLRQLRRTICGQNDKDTLLRIMVRYGDWLKSLPINQRAELAGLDPSERLKQIKKILEQQERQRFQELVYRKLDPKDLEVIKEWLSSLVQRNVDLLREKLPAEVMEQLKGKRDPVDLLFELSRYRREFLHESNIRPLDMIEITDADIAELSRQLSPEARSTLAEATNKNDKLTAVKYWVLAATVSRRLHRVSEEELKHYLETRVDASTRDSLENLPREQMLSQLRRMYSMERVRPRDGDGGRRPFRGWGPNEGWPPWSPGRPGPPPGSEPPGPDAKREPPSEKQPPNG